MRGWLSTVGSPAAALVLSLTVLACSGDSLDSQDTRESSETSDTPDGPDTDLPDTLDTSTESDTGVDPDNLEPDDLGPDLGPDDTPDTSPADSIEDTTPDSGPLPDDPGLVLWLMSSTVTAEPPPVLEVYAGTELVARLEAATHPGFALSQPDAEGQVQRGPYLGAKARPFPLAGSFSHPILLAWAKGHDSLEVRLLGSEHTLQFTAGAADQQVLDTEQGRLVILAQAGTASASRPMVGLTFGEDLSGRDDVKALVSDERPTLLKVYHGSRPFLLVPGCTTDSACAPDGPKYPCVSGCACHCDDTSCDCDWSNLEDNIRSRAISTARRWVGDGDLSQVRLHYVFKRSLGGTSSCDANGEVDVDAETYGRFFAQAVKMATRLNAELGFPLIASLSPMNEANHPLQDGPQENGVGQGTAAGFLDFRDAISQTTGCPTDRYIAEDPEVLAMLAEAMVRGEAARSELSPEVALSLYLDVEQTDPFQTADDGGPAPVVTPLPRYFAGLSAALAGRVFGDRELWVDTYPASWAPPWSEVGGARHIDPETGGIFRAEPTFAADRAVERALVAADDFEDTFGSAVDVVLGEVGWSTFDRDDEAQAAFLERLAWVSEATAFRDPRYRGWLWFKDTDRDARAWPEWDVGELPGGGIVLPCNDSELATWVCMIEVFDRMEAAWGLLTSVREPKPAWERFVEALAR